MSLMIRKIKYSAVMMVCCIFLHACTQVDNYMLGKDNTPKPKVLEPIKSRVTLRTHWSTSIGKSNKTITYLKLKPVIQGNIIYTADASGMINALDKSTGKIVWSNQLHTGIISGPTVAEGFIALGTDASDLVILNQKTGIKVWETHLSEDALSKSAIHNHHVFTKTIDGHLYAFELATGKKLWVSEHGAPSLILKAGSSPVIMGELILVGFSDGKLDAIDMKTGRVIWQRSIAYATGASDVERLVDIDADPIIRGSTVYLASYQGFVGALNLTDGQFVWNKPASIYKNMAMDSNALYVTDSRDVLWAFNIQTGQVIWKQNALKARGVTEPLLMGNRLIVGDKTGYLHVISIENGELIGRTQLNGAIIISPDVSGQMVYVMTANGILHAVTVSV